MGGPPGRSQVLAAAVTLTTGEQLDPKHTIEGNIRLVDSAVRVTVVETQAGRPGLLSRVGST